MIARAVDRIATRETHEQKAMVQRVRDAIAELLPEQDAIRKHDELIVRLFEKLATIAEQSYLDAETEAPGVRHFAPIFTSFPKVPPAPARV